MTFIPLAASATPATVPANLGASLYGWTCGGAGTTVNLKYLPTSCRG